jgi:hypothetical protein
LLSIRGEQMDTNKKIPKAPPAHSLGYGGQYVTHTADDNKTVTAVYLNGELLPPKPKPRWWQFWRWGERDPYRRWQ